MGHLWSTARRRAAACCSCCHASLPLPLRRPGRAERQLLQITRLGPKSTQEEEPAAPGRARITSGAHFAQLPQHSRLTPSVPFGVCATQARVERWQSNRRSQFRDLPERLTLTEFAACVLLCVESSAAALLDAEPDFTGIVAVIDDTCAINRMYLSALARGVLSETLVPALRVLPVSAAKAFQQRLHAGAPLDAAPSTVFVSHGQHHLTVVGYQTVAQLNALQRVAGAAMQTLQTMRMTRMDRPRRPRRSRPASVRAVPQGI